MSQSSTLLDSGSGQSWLSSKRIRRQALLLTISLWLGYAVNMSAPGMRDRFGHLKGADFLHSYILGTIALDHRGSALYDPRVQRDIGDWRVPASSGDYFLPVYPPQYSLFWVWLAKLRYPWAAPIWIFLSATIYTACCYAVWRICLNLHSYGATVALLAAAFPGFYELINFGQNSALALACFTGMYFALRARRALIAGLCLGLLAYKPQLGLVPACAFLATCGWPRKAVADRAGVAVETQFAASHVVLGAILAIAVQIGVVWLWYGSDPLFNYVRVVTHLGTAAKILEPRPYLMHSLRAFWDLLLPWPNLALALYILSAVAAVVLAIVCWRKPIPLEHRFAVILLATVLVAPHLTVYDLVVLAPAFLWIADCLRPRAIPSVAWLLYFSYVLPFAGPLSRWTHLQLSVISFAALMVVFIRTVSQEV
jgi:alpha-1,2-mannosyltransferase